jgi:sugar/nucleoside kinase (ribokinase family)
MRRVVSLVVKLAPIILAASFIRLAIYPVPFSKEVIMTSFFGPLRVDISGAPRAGGAVRIGSKREYLFRSPSLGGGASNSASTYQRLATTLPHIVGFVGPGMMGQCARALVGARFCGYRLIDSAEQTALSVLLEDENGETAIYANRPTHDPVRTKSALAVELSRSGITHLLVAGFSAGDAEIVEHILDEAAKRGITTYFLPSSSQIADPERMLALMGRATISGINDVELDALSGVRGAVPGVCRLVERGIKGTIIVTLGDRGVLVHCAATNEWHYHRAFDVGVNHGGVAGAGDCFSGALLAFLVDRGAEGFAAGLRLASAAAAMYVARRVFKCWADVESFAAATPARKFKRLEVDRGGAPRAAAGPAASSAVPAAAVPGKWIPIAAAALIGILAGHLATLYGPWA